MCKLALDELCTLHSETNGIRLRPEYRAPRRVANVQVRRAAVEKAAKMLKFEWSVTLEQGLRELVSWRQSIQSARAAVRQ